MKKVVKPRNLLGFQIWLEKLGYRVSIFKDGGFNFKCRKEYGLVTKDLGGNGLAFKLGAEFEDHLASPDYIEVNVA